MAIDRDQSNPGLKLIYNLLPKEQAKSMEENVNYPCKRCTCKSSVIYGYQRKFA